MTAGTKNAFVTPNSGITCKDARRIDLAHARTVWQPCTRPIIDQPVPAMWNIGMTARLTRLSSNRHESATCSTPLKKLSLVSITPLGSPVVPDV